jgi:acetate kinase
MASGSILALNGGSSSFKFGLFAGPELRETRRGEADDLPRLLAELRDVGLRAVGHRIVHGGAAHRAPEWVTEAVRAALRDAVALAPDHLPAELAGLDEVDRALPGVRQFVCYDTWFHRTLPRLARLYALPRRYAEQGVLRFGFHGLSYEWIARRLSALEPRRCGGKAVVAHLGGGASLCAMLRGVSIDTTMGFTPTGGLVMGTRPGDLDPGIVLWLLRQDGMDPARLGRLLEKESGLLGLAGTGDMRKLLASAQSEAAEAVALFCRSAAQGIAAMTTSLGGLDCLVFTGGIGAYAAPIRARIAAQLGWLGVRLDEDANEAGSAVISDGDAVTVRVIATDEERQIALHGETLLQE